tara:strand:+ start:3504 stop:4139 length:636 start_codon:yes stop_codon:yes gene_type:complete
VIRLVTFDLDGVLVDACEWHRVALNESLKEICNYEISLEDHYKTFNGIPTKVKLNKLTEMGILNKEQHERVYDLKQEKTVKIISENAELRQEKVDLINWLKDRQLHVACYTNSIRMTADLMLQKTGIFDLFELVITNQDVKNPKPHPEGYLKVLEHFQIDKSSMLIVEDSPKGMAAALASGCNIIQVKNPDDVCIKLFKEYLNEDLDSNGR